MRKLHIQEYDAPAPFRPDPIPATQLVLPLRQSAGTANVPVVQAGQKVQAGQPLGQLPEGALGAILHAPVDATVTAVTDKHIALTRIP